MEQPYQADRRPARPIQADSHALLAVEGKVDFLRDIVGRIDNEIFPALEVSESWRICAQFPRLDYIDRGVGSRQILLTGGCLGAIAPFKVIPDFGGFRGKDAPGELQLDGACSRVHKVLDYISFVGQCPSTDPDGRLGGCGCLEGSYLAENCHTETKPS